MSSRRVLVGLAVAAAVFTLGGCVSAGDVAHKVAPAADVGKLATKTPNSRFLEIPGYPHIALYFGVAKVGPPVLAALAGAFGPARDPACLEKPPPKTARYDFPFTVTLHKR